MLIERAETMKCRVFFHPLDEYDGYLATPRDIVINTRLHASFQREVLAHELGHVHYGHDWRRPHDKARDERQADMYAARLLISPEDYALAECTYGPHVGALAQALQVSTAIVKAWQASHGLSGVELQRLGDFRECLPGAGSVGV